MKVNFTKLKEAKNTIRFEEDPDPNRGPIFGNIYVQKWFVNKRNDKEHISITIEDE